MAATNFTPIQLYFSTTASAVPVAANLAQGELAINITDGKLYYEDNAGVVQVIATKGAGTIGGSTTQIQYNNAGALAGNAAMVFNNSTNVTTLTTLNLTNALGAIYGGTAQSTYAQGDFLYASASNTLSKLGIGTVNYILTSTGTVPQWSAPSSIIVQTATNLAGGLAGSVPYQSALDTTTFLAIGAANRVMTSTGSAPQWVTSLTGLTGVSSSSITNTSLTSGRVVVSTTAGLQADDADLTFDGTTLSAGGFSTVGLSTLVKTVTIGNSSFNGSAVFAAATPAKLYMGTGTVTDVTSAISATNAVGAIASLGITPIAATNTSVTYTNAATLYIAGAPSAGTNVTLTNPYALYVAAGDAYFGGTVTAGTVNLTTLDLTNLEVTNIKAKDGTAAMTIADSTGVVSFTANPVLSGGTANGVLYLNGSKVATSGSALTFDGTNLSSTGGATFQGGPSGYGGGEVRLGTTASGQQNGISTLGTGTSQLIFDHRGTGNTGNFVWRNGTGGATTLMYLNSLGNLGLNVTPSVWGSGIALEMPNGVALFANSSVSASYLTTNATYNGTSFIYKTTNLASYYNQQNGIHAWATAASGTAGNAITFTQAMTLNASGNLGLGFTSISAVSGLSSSPVVAQVGNSSSGNGQVIVGTSAGGFVIDQSNAGNTTTTLRNIYGATSALAKLNLESGVINFKTGTSYTQAMVIDASQNLGLGVTPSAWNTSYKAEEIGFVGNGLIGFNPSDFAMSSGAYYDSAGWKYSTTNSLGASFYEQYNGQHLWYNKTAVSHSAGDAISFTQAMTLAANGNLAVGVTDAQTRLTVNDNSSSSTTPGTNPIIWIGGGNTNVNTLAEIGFTYGSPSWAETYAPATIGYQLTSSSGFTKGALTFCTRDVTTDTAPTERARITSDGNFLIGNTVVDPASGYSTQRGLGYAAGTGKLEVATTANAPVLELGKNNANDGSILVFRKQSTSVGAVSVAATGITLTGTNGITFTATQSASSDANTLDDYEEGTWTPAISGITSVAYTQQIGNYIKIGKQVTCFARLLVSGTGSGAAVNVTGLPFTSANAAGSGNGGGAMGYKQLTALSIYPHVADSSSTIEFYLTESSAPTAFTLTGSVSGYHIFYVTYLV